MVDNIVDEAIAKSVSGYISESMLFQIVDDNNIDDMAFSILCEKLAIQGITIVDDSEYNSLIDITDKEKNNSEEVQDDREKLQKVLDVFSELSQCQMEQCLKILTDKYYNLIANDNTHKSGKRLKTEDKNDSKISVIKGYIPELPSKDVKIGEYIKTAMTNLSLSGFVFTDDEIQQMTTSYWSKSTFHITYPFMRIVISNDFNNKDANGYSRFWKKPFVFGDYTVLISKEWYPKHYVLFDNWYNSLQFRDENYSEEKAHFIASISARPLQYSYVAICLKSFLRCSDNNGIASLSDMAEYFDEFYSNRRNNGNVVEQQDSIIYKGYTLSKLEQLIKHNPLSRSYLKRYLFMKKENKTEFVYMEHELWVSLSEKDKQDIEDILDQLLANYYTKILLA